MVCACRLHKILSLALEQMGKKLAKIHVPISIPNDHTGSYIVPIKGVEEILRVLGNDEAQVTLMPDKIALESGPTQLISKLLSGKYPDLSHIIPEKKENSIALHREELISLLRQIVLFTPDEASAVRFSFTTGELHLAAMHGEIGEGNVKMAVNYGGEKLDIAFNPHFFLDILRHSEDEVVNLNLSHPFNPGLITDSSTAQFVLMCP